MKYLLPALLLCAGCDESAIPAVRVSRDLVATTSDCQTALAEAQHESEWLRQRLNTMRAQMKLQSDMKDESDFRLQACLNREQYTLERIQQAQAELKEWTQQLEPVCSWDNRGGE